MTTREAMIHQLKELKGKPLKQKLTHILTYFWLPILAAVLICVFAVSYIFHIVNTKETVLAVTCINAYAQQDQVEEFVAAFARQGGIDLEECEIQLSADMYLLDSDPSGSYYTMQVLAARIASQTVDVLVLDFSSLSGYLYQEVFADLTQVLSPEQQEKYGAYFLYMDMAFLEDRETGSGEATEYPDPTKPELMISPVPVALRLPENGKLQQTCYPMGGGAVAMGIVINSQSISNALLFLDYVMQ